MDKVFISRILDRCIYFALLLLFLKSCGNGTGNAKKNRIGPRSVESVRALKDTLIQMDSHEEQCSSLSTTYLLFSQSCFYIISRRKGAY